MIGLLSGRATRLCLSCCKRFYAGKVETPYEPKPKPRRQTLVQIVSFTNKLYEPEFSTGPETPLLKLVNVRLRAYDFAVLESFQAYAHNVCRILGLDVTSTWATAAKTNKVLVFKPRSTIPIAEYHLAMYERTIQIANLEPPTAQILLQLLTTHLPEGAHLTLKQHEPQDEEERYIPDLELKALKSELSILQDPKRK